MSLPAQKTRCDMRIKINPVLILSAMLSCALLAPGCEKNQCELCSQEGELRHVTVGLGADAVPTKVRGVTPFQENVVRNCRLYVFTQEGYQIGNWSAEDGIFDLYLTDGVYEFVAVANLDALPGTDASRDELFAIRVPIEKNTVDPGTGGFVMVGRLENHVIKGDEKITVEVRRLVSKVSYTVRSAFESHMASYPFEVDEIYMTNVVGDNDLGITRSLQPAEGTWYNKMNYDAAAAAAQPYPAEMLHGDFAKRMASGDSLVSGHTFYVYPNANEDRRDTTRWSPRCTRFVVRAHLNGIQTYYAVTLNTGNQGVLPNKHYHVDLTIKGWGSDHPEIETVEQGAISGVFSVEDWQEGAVISPIF